MAYTDVWDVTAPLDTQAANQGAADFRATKLDIMQRVASFGAGILANRPTPETTGATANWTGVMYWATDTKQVFMWSGTAWVDISADIPSGGSGGTHFSDNTLADVVNPSGATALNTVAVPATFDTDFVVRINAIVYVGVISAGTEFLTMTANGTDIFINAPQIQSNDIINIDTVILGISGAQLSSWTNVTNTNHSTQSATLFNNNVVYATGTPFNVVLGLQRACTATFRTAGMSAYMV